MRRTTIILILLAAAACARKSETTAAAPRKPLQDLSNAKTNIVSAMSVTPGKTCSHTTEIEVTEIVGQPMKFEESKKSECKLVAAADTKMFFVFDIKDGVKTYDSMTKGKSFEPLSGLGDKAAVDPATGTVVAVKNNRSYFGTFPDKQKSIALAQKIVPRL
ncbi:MAG TPA: hypothetical protein VER58_12165 [Thermoanaerobaculia bacterium]|nr:hypothetical protein [Thermoanaerobaculia bacterium]